jgi:DNA-binding NarL/FixJ family response regulator
VRPGGRTFFLKHPQGKTYIMITVALVDDHVITRKGLKTILESGSEIKVTREASHGLELMELLGGAYSLPDIVILDISMPVMNGYETVDAIKTKYPDIHILIFSLLVEDDAIINMITRGACGYLPKSADPLVLVEAVKTIYRTGFYVSELARKEYFRKTLVEKREGFYGKAFLTAKEIAFIKLACSNLNYQEIALQLNVKPRTVENYRDNLFQKLGINNRAALAVYAFKNGIVSILP